jgi:hypothetical protein
MILAHTHTTHNEKFCALYLFTFGYSIHPHSKCLASSAFLSDSFFLTNTTTFSAFEFIAHTLLWSKMLLNKHDRILLACILYEGTINATKKKSTKRGSIRGYPHWKGESLFLLHEIICTNRVCTHWNWKQKSINNYTLYHDERQHLRA